MEAVEEVIDKIDMTTGIEGRVDTKETEEIGETIHRTMAAKEATAKTDVLTEAEGMTEIGEAKEIREMIHRTTVVEGVIDKTEGMTGATETEETEEGTTGNAEIAGMSVMITDDKNQTRMMNQRSHTSATVNLTEKTELDPDSGRHTGDIDVVPLLSGMVALKLNFCRKQFQHSNSMEAITRTTRFLLFARGF